jgi:choice-of-anchor C domain-containing protein
LFYESGNDQSIYHLADNPATDLRNDLLNGKNFLPNTHYEVSPLDLAILADCGFTLNGPLNLIQNGGFEVGPDPKAYLPLQPGSTAITGWTVVHGGIDYVGTDWVSAHGNRSLDLNGTPGVGGVSQIFNTTPGQKYHVTFDMAGHYSGLLQTLKVSAAGKSEEFAFQARTDPKNMGWERKTWDFTATAAQTTLEFDSLQTGYQYGGPALDNVSVMPLQTSTTTTSNSPLTTPTPTTGSNPPSTTTTNPTFVTLGGAQSQVTPALTLPSFSGSSNDELRFIGASSSTPPLGSTNAGLTSVGNLSDLVITMSSQSGSGSNDLLPQVPLGMAESTMPLAGAITPDLATVVTGTIPIFGQTNQWNTALPLPGWTLMQGLQPGDSIPST